MCFHIFPQALKGNKIRVLLMYKEIQLYISQVHHLKCSSKLPLSNIYVCETTAIFKSAKTLIQNAPSAPLLGVLEKCLLC